MSQWKAGLHHPPLSVPASPPGSGLCVKGKDDRVELAGEENTMRVLLGYKPVPMTKLCSQEKDSTPHFQELQEHRSWQYRTGLTEAGRLSPESLGWETGQLRSPTDSAVTGKPGPGSGTQLPRLKNGSVVSRAPPGCDIPDLASKPCHSPATLQLQQRPQHKLPRPQVLPPLSPALETHILLFLYQFSFFRSCLISRRTEESSHFHHKYLQALRDRKNKHSLLCWRG